MNKCSHKENAVAATVTFKMKMQQVIEKVAEEQFCDICGAEVIYEEELDEEEEEIQIEDLEQAPHKMEDNKLKYMILWKRSYRYCKNSMISLFGIMMRC